MNTMIKIKKPNFPVYFILPYLILVMLDIKTVYARYLNFFFAFAFIITALISSNKIKIKRKYLYLFSFFIIYVTLGLINGNPMQIVKNISMLVLNLTPFFIFDYLDSLKSKNKLYINVTEIKRTMNILLTYTISITTYYLFRNPYIARYMANFDPSRGIDTSMGINIDLPIAIGGGYTLVYGIILLPPLFIYLLKNQIFNIKNKTKPILISIAILFFIIKAGFATAFLLSGGATLITMVLSSKKRIINKIIIILLVLCFIFMVSNPFLLNLTIQMISELLPENSIISVRLNEIIPAIYGRANESSFLMRIHGLEKSINAIAENPIFGVGYKVGFDYTSISNYASLHTEWIDILAQYGIVFGGLLLLFIGFSFRDLLKLFSNTEMELLIRILIMTVIILGFLNPIFTSSIYLILMVYVPCYLLNYSKKIEKEK